MAHNSFTLYSHDWPDRAEPDPQQRAMGSALLETFRRDLPGAWGDNRFLQSDKFRGAVHVAIKAVMDLVGSCSVQVLRRKRKARGRTTFAGKTVAKALPTPHAQASDEEYTPFEDEDHRLCKLVDRPNEQETISELLSKVVLQNRLTGVGPLWKVPNSAGKPLELWPLYTALLQPTTGPTREFPNGAWRVQPYRSAGWVGGGLGGLGSAGAVLPGEEVCRFMEPHPLLPWDGFSPLTAEAVQLDILEAIDESRWSAMTHGVQLDAMLIAPGMDEADAKRVQADMTAKMGGSRNARRFGVVAPPFGDSAKYDLKTFSNSPRDMDFSAGWEQMVGFVLAVFGVPKSVAGLATTTSYAELFAALRQFHHRQGQYVRRMAEWLTKELAWPWCSFPGEFKVQIDLPTLEDPDLMEKQLSADVNIRTVNQRLALRNLPPVEDGDVPEPIYLELLKAKHLPQQPAPGMPGGESGGDGGGNPLAGVGDTPTGGAPPAPENPAGEGARPPLTKAMNTMTGSEGGYLVAPDRLRVRKRRRAARKWVAKALKSLGGN